MDESQSESKTTTNGKEISDTDKWKSESRAKAHGQVANEHRPEKQQKRHQNGTQEPKIDPKKAVNGTTRGQKSPQEGLKRVHKRSPSTSQTKKRTKTTPGPSWELLRGRFADFSLTYRGLLGRPKTIQNEAENDPKSKRKSRSEQKRSKRIKDPSWSDLGRFGGTMWEPGDPKSIGKRNISCTFTFSKIRRFEDGSGSHFSGKKAPRGAKMIPKRDPRSTPERSQTNVKIQLNFDAKTKRAGQGLRIRPWGGPPHREAPQGLQVGGPHGTGAAPKHPCVR